MPKIVVGDAKPADLCAGLNVRKDCKKTAKICLVAASCGIFSSFAADLAGKSVKSDAH